MKKGCLAAACVLLTTIAAGAEEEPRLQLNPTGRILIDGALYASPEKSMFPDGMAIPEVRLGVKMKYGKWDSMIDVGHAYAKIGLRNMWIQYNFTDHDALRVGNFIHQYGLQSTSNSQKTTMEQPIASALYTPILQMGIMYTHYTPSFFGAVSGHVESSARTNVMNEPAFNQQGYGLLTRLVWRDADPGKPTLQLGISGGFATPERRLEGVEDVHDGFVVSANFPTKVTQLTAIGTSVTEARNLFKFTPELLLSNGRLALEAQYFFQQINRKNSLRSYRTQSGYATLRGILFGDRYSYVSSTAQVSNPKNKTLECVLDYNYATLSDADAGIFGGRANSFSVTFNYYFNPYITARLNYSYTHAWDRADHLPVMMNAIQARLMVLF